MSRPFSFKTFSNSSNTISLFLPIIPFSKTKSMSCPVLISSNISSMHDLKTRLALFLTTERLSIDFFTINPNLLWGRLFLETLKVKLGVLKKEEFFSLWVAGRRNCFFNISQCVILGSKTTPESLNGKSCSSCRASSLQNLFPAVTFHQSQKPVLSFPLNFFKFR